MAAITSLNKYLAEYTPPPNLSGRYRSWHVEALLNQASDLLDRCISERRELQSLDIKRTENKIKLASSIADAKLFSARLTSNWYASAITGFDKPEYQSLLNEYLTALMTAKNHAHNLAFEPPGPSNSKNITEYSALAQVKKSELEKLDKTLQIDTLRTDLDAMITSFKAHVDNTEAERLAQEPGGALNYDVQINLLQRRIVDDFQDAYDRLIVANQGLKKFYGYNISLPVLGSTPNETVLSILDETCLWTRAAVRWMVASAQYEQVFTSQLSARSVVGSNNWQQAMEQLLETSETTITLWVDKSRAAGCRFCRLRGISAFVSGSEELWSASVTLPTLAVSVQLNTEGNEVHVKLDQTDLPKCILGRIQNRQATREPEVGGANSLRNSSPFGFQNDKDGLISMQINWPYGAVPTDIKKPEDFQLEFYLAGLPK